MNLGLMKITGASDLLSNTNQYIIIRNDGIEFVRPRLLSEIRQFLSYEQMSAVNRKRGILFSDIEFVNTGGAGNIEIIRVQNAQAEAVVAFVENKLAGLKTAERQGGPPISIADELRKLAELRNSGVLSDAEFEAQKKRLLEPMQPGEQVQVPEAMDQLFERRVISLVKEGRKIEAVMLYRELTNAGLKEAKDQVEYLAAKHGLQVPQNTGCLSLIVLITMISAIGYAIV